ncbi:MAG: DMT family transporter, partial [Planctomycetales bacterium]|nr:DMT family transporter [Planctomycetales bacterium]
VNLAPVAMPFLLVWLASETINRRELIATGIAVAGMGLMFAADFRLSAEFFYGDLICVGSMLLLGLYLTLGRRHRHHPTVWLYVVPLYYYAAAVSLASAPVLSSSLQIDWAKEWPWVLALGVIPTIIGHSLINNAMRCLRGQIVALASMVQFVFAGVLAYFFPPHETPDWSFYPACALIVIAGLVVVRGSGSGSRVPGSGKADTPPHPGPETRAPRPDN